MVFRNTAELYDRRHLFCSKPWKAAGRMPLAHGIAEFGRRAFRAFARRMRCTHEDGPDKTVDGGKEIICVSALRT